MVEYVLVSTFAAIRDFVQAVPRYVQALDTRLVLAGAAVVVVLALTLSSRTRH